MRNVLKIDTTKMGRVQVELVSGDKHIKSEVEQRFGSQVLLELIEKILREAGVEKKFLTAIEVKRVGESFTGLRVGVSVANALGFALGIPVNGKAQEIGMRY